MTETINIGWLKDNNGGKFAPKTLTSQIQTNDGILLDNKIQSDINALRDEIKAYTDEKISEIPGVDTYNKLEIDEILENKADASHNHDSTYDTKGAANAALDSAKIYADSQDAAILESANAYADDLNSVINVRVSTLETWHKNFTEVSEEEINALFT